MPWAGLLNAGGATIQRRTSKKRCSSNAISMRRSLRYSSRNAAWPNAAENGGMPARTRIWFSTVAASPSSFSSIDASA